MRSAECQVAAAEADHFIQAEASDLLRLAGSGLQAPQDSVRLQEDSDQVPVSARLDHGLPAFHLLLHRTEHFHRAALYPAVTSL
jgi:hypothetical protein